jgi:hypothetical protein
MITDGDFESRTGGAISLSLNTSSPAADGSEINGNCNISMDIISGNENDYNNNNYRGLLRVKINAIPEVNKENYAEGISYEYPLREFTNKKTIIHVAVSVKNNVVTAFINDKPVAVSTAFKLTYGGKCIRCGVPAGTKFKSIFWNNTTNDAEHIKVYMSNIKITKE